MIRRNLLWAVALGGAAVLSSCETSTSLKSQDNTPQPVIGNAQEDDRPGSISDAGVFAVARSKGSDFPIVKPINCTLGQDCFVLLYPDRDPSSGATDFNCGQLTYDGHKGTDFAIASWTPDTDVPVLASAPGTVQAVRDGVRDHRIASESEFGTVKGIECGNGVLMDHGNGWTTQYCHLEQGSVSVQQGDRLEAGDPIGQVGLSGKTTFPHVHLTVRYQGEVVDPFVGQGSKSGCNVGERSPLWNDANIDYVSTGLVRAGFADGSVDMPELWLDAHRSDRFSNTGPAIVFWTQIYGVQQGDTEILQLTDPNGRKQVDVNQPIQASKRVYLSYGGKTTRNGPLVKGTWTGRYRLVRDGKTIVDVTKTSQVE
ncbi:MAG: M23 family metallopeptidase [Cyanobacteria bacterium P01_D01_bin.73]